MTQTTASPPIITPPPVAADLWPAAPEGIPPNRWNQAVALVRELVPTATYFWPVWATAYKRCLSHVEGGASGTVFSALFDVYEESGGQGSAFEPWPVPAARIGVDAAGVVETINETNGRQTWQRGKRIVMDIGGRLSGPSDA